MDCPLHPSWLQSHQPSTRSLAQQPSKEGTLSEHQQQEATKRDTSNAINAAGAAGTSNAATFLSGLGRGLGSHLLLPRGYGSMEWEEKHVWDKRLEVLKKQVLPQLASSFRPDLRAWRKAPENWPRAGQADADILGDWLRFEKEVRLDEQFADVEPPVRKPAPVLYPIQTLGEHFSTCMWRIFLPDGFYGCAEEDIPPWLQRWCQHLLETTPKSEHPPLV